MPLFVAVHLASTTHVLTPPAATPVWQQLGTIEIVPGRRGCSISSWERARRALQRGASPPPAPPATTRFTPSVTFARRYPRLWRPPQGKTPRGSLASRPRIFTPTWTGRCRSRLLLRPWRSDQDKGYSEGVAVTWPPRIVHVWIGRPPSAYLDVWLSWNLGAECNLPRLHQREPSGKRGHERGEQPHRRVPELAPLAHPQGSFLVMHYDGWVTNPLGVSAGTNAWAGCTFMHADFFSADQPVFNNELLDLC